MTVTTEEASAQFLTLLDHMTDGEAVTITRHGKPFARLVQVEAERESKSDELLQRIEAFRAAHGVDQETFEEMMAEGRRH